jgi:serine protease Do
MKSRFFIPVIAVVAAGGAALSLHAQDQPKPKLEFNFNGDPRGGAAMEETLRKMIERMGLGGEAREQMEKALEQWKQGGEGGRGTQQQQAPQQQQFRFEFKDDGSGPKMYRNGKEVTPEDLGDLMGPMQKQLEEMFKQQFGGEGPGSGGNPLEEMMKELQKRMQGGGGLGGPRTGRERSRFSKQHTAALAEWRPLTKAARESTVRVLRDGDQVALGTIVSADGYALTKASEVDKGSLEVEFENGRIVTAKVVDKMDAYDLALLKVEANGLPVGSIVPEEVAVGTLVAAVSVDEDPLATGVISVPARSLSEKTKGALGIEFKMDAELDGTGVPIGKLVTGCAAEKAGLKPDDKIMAVNGQPVPYPATLMRIVSALKPGDPVKVRYEREGKEAELEFPLSSREELLKVRQEAILKETGMKQLPDRRALDPTAQMGSSLSGNASGYPKAVQSDLTIDANECGGPVVDVDGRIVAITIARAERVSTYMVPGKVVADLLSDLKSGKFTLAKDEDTLRGELRESEQELQKAEAALKEAEARRSAAAEQLKKFDKK